MSNKDGLSYAFLFWLLVVVCVAALAITGHYRSEARAKFRETKVALKERVNKDSLIVASGIKPFLDARRKEQEDSIAHVNKMYMDSVWKHTLVAVDEDSFYHTNMGCIGVSQAGRVRTMSQYDAEREGMYDCETCYDIEQAYTDFVKGDLIPVEDAWKYVDEDDK